MRSSNAGGLPRGIHEAAFGPLGQRVPQGGHRHQLRGRCCRDSLAKRPPAIYETARRSSHRPDAPIKSWHRTQTRCHGINAKFFLNAVAPGTGSFGAIIRRQPPQSVVMPGGRHAQERTPGRAACGETNMPRPTAADLQAGGPRRCRGVHNARGRSWLAKHWG